MELYQLRTFLVVAEEGNLTRAAEKLFTSQPAVSSQIRALEDEFGVRLFDRSAKGMALTTAGAKMRDQARMIVDAARNFSLQAEDLRKEVSGELVLGLNNSPDILRLIPILRVLTEQHPALTYDMVAGSSGVILQGIDDGTIAAGFFEGACTNPRVGFDVISEVELCLIAPKAWEAELSAPDWKLLESKPWIFVSPLCSYFRTIEHICKEQGLQIQARFRSHEDITALNFVAEGMGVTITSRGQLETFARKDALYVLPHFHATVPLCLGYLASRAENPAIRAMRDATQKIWEKSAEPAGPAPQITARLETPRRATENGRRLNRTRKTRRQS
jgi:DNA-binding transcriptional LysR family regulator